MGAVYKCDRQTEGNVDRERSPRVGDSQPARLMALLLSTVSSRFRNPGEALSSFSSEPLLVLLFLLDPQNSNLITSAGQITYRRARLFGNFASPRRVRTADGMSSSYHGRVGANEMVVRAWMNQLRRKTCQKYSMHFAQELVYGKCLDCTVTGQTIFFG